jgi:hypothetical protein
MISFQEGGPYPFVRNKQYLEPRGRNQPIVSLLKYIDCLHIHWSSVALIWHIGIRRDEAAWTRSCFTRNRCGFIKRVDLILGNHKTQRLDGLVRQVHGEVHLDRPYPVLRLPRLELVVARLTTVPHLNQRSRPIREALGIGYPAKRIALDMPA